MDLLPDNEQQQVIDAIAAYLAGEHGIAAVQAVNARQPLTDPAQWRRLGELGWLGIGMEEKFGGAGFTLAEEMLLSVEAGRYLLSPALLGSLVGARLAAARGCDELARSIIAGHSIVAPALAALPAQKLGPSIDGEFLLLESRDADFALLVDRDNAALVPLAEFRERRDQRCIDEKVRLATATLSGARAIASLGGEALPARTLVLCAAYLTGIAQALQEQAVTYARERRQFGQPIGAFQAIKHRCADMALRGEAALAMTLQAGLGLLEDNGEGFFDAHCAKILAQDAALQNGADCVHIHGGMGFTAELPVHLFYKRAQVMSQFFCDKHELQWSLCQHPGGSHS